MKLIFEFHFKKKEGFSESDFMGIVSKRLSALGKEMPISFFGYQEIDEGYIFKIQYKPVLQGITYQPILGCFGDLDRVYEFISSISMPADKMHQEN